MTDLKITDLTVNTYDNTDNEALKELTNRVQDIDNSYRAIAEKMGQLYMFVESKELSVLADSLDKPMRNASENEQSFAAILEDLQMATNRRL